MFSANTSVNLLSGVHLSTFYLLVGIVLATFSLYIAIKKNRSESKESFANAITDKILADTKNEIAETVKSAVIVEVRKEVSNLDFKISQNGKNTNNLGDVAARTEEKVDGLTRSMEYIANNVKYNGDRITEHLGWHVGYEDRVKPIKAKK
jgi:hypothetical protein